MCSSIFSMIQECCCDCVSFGITPTLGQEISSVVPKLHLSWTFILFCNCLIIYLKRPYLQLKLPQPISGIKTWMCNSRKYPYLPHGRDFFWDPPTPLEIPIKLHTFFSIFWPYRTPNPPGNSNPFCGGSMDIFWNCTMLNCTKKTGNCSNIAADSMERTESKLIVQKNPRKLLKYCCWLCGTKWHEIIKNIYTKMCCSC